MLETLLEIVRCPADGGPFALTAHHVDQDGHVIQGSLNCGTCTLGYPMVGGEFSKRFYRSLYSHLNILPTDHHMFDWWTAPIATHHTLEEIESWFGRNGMEAICANPPLGDAGAEKAQIRVHASISMKGRRLG